MLARIANSLYWTGRYIERSEHLARYLRVQYFSMQDAPMSQSREFTLRSILNMYGVEPSEGEVLEEQAILKKVGMDYDNPHSIRSTIRLARENARSLRHMISSELWESVNTFYVYSNSRDPEIFATQGLYEFTNEVDRNCAIIRSRIDDTLLQNDTWVLIKLGVHLERTVQVLRILNSKLNDIDIITDRGANRALQQYQGTVLLKILQGFDMHRKAYRQTLTPKTTVEFLVGHPHFARSVTYNMGCVHRLLDRMDANSNDRNPVLFQAGKLYHKFRYLEYEDIANQLNVQLASAIDQVYELHNAIAERYLNTVNPST
ncbi:MAG: alpha-E domain-containing protein [Bacteroidota bacterium]